MNRWISFPIEFMTLEIADELFSLQYNTIKYGNYLCIIQKED